MNRAFLVIPLLSMMPPCCHEEPDWGMTLPEAINAIHPVQDGCSIFEILTDSACSYNILVWKDKSNTRWHLKSHRSDFNGEEHYFYIDVDTTKKKRSFRIIKSIECFEKLDAIDLNNIVQDFNGPLVGIIVGNDSYMTDAFLKQDTGASCLDIPSFYFYTGKVRFVSYSPSIDTLLHVPTDCDSFSFSE